MREIKFRGLSVEPLVKEDDWLCGSLVYVNYDDEKAYVDGSEVKFETVSQYTGIKDRYKKEIYEGDITTNELYESEGLAFVVYYDNEEGMFKQQPFIFKDNGKKLGNKDLALQMDSVANKKIIGNIYENPELLEVDND